MRALQPPSPTETAARPSDPPPRAARGRRACRRARRLLDARAEGHALGPADVAFLAQHQAVCAVCRADEALAVLLGPRHPADAGPALPLTPRGNDAMVQRVLAAVRGAPAAPAVPARASVPRGWPAWVVAGTAAALVVAAVALLVWGLVAGPAGRLAPTPPSGPGTAPLGPAEPRPVAAGERLAPSATTRAAWQLPGRATVHFAPATAARLLASEPSAVRLQLTAGQLLARVPRLDPGGRFRVETPVGDVEVVGTAFTVRVDPTGLHVRVLDGVVAVRPARAAPDAPRLLVRAGQSLHCPAGQAEPRLSGLDDAALQREVQAIWGAPIALPDVMPARPSAAARPAAPSAPRVRPAGTARGAPTRATAGTPPPTPTEDLHEAPATRARRLRERADWAGAATAYGEAIASAASPGEAQLARMARAELMLDQLGDAAGALAAFEEYLRVGGSQAALAEEALWGRARCLHLLGRVADEARALQRLLAQFPLGAFAFEARARLEALGRAPAPDTIRPPVSPPSPHEGEQEAHDAPAESRPPDRGLPEEVQP